jgi:CRP/FNR family transcriptional regulator
VKEGVIKVYDISAGGEERLISFKTAGTIFSLGWLFSRHSKALYYYEAYTDCTLGIVDKSEFMTKVTHDNEFSLSLMNFLITEHIGDGIRFNALEQPTSRQKLLYMIKTFCLTYGVDTAKDIVRITIPLRQQDIANFLGLRRETIALELSRLKKEGVLTYSRRHYTVMTNRLNDLLDEQYNPGISFDPAQS